MIQTVQAALAADMEDWTPCGSHSTLTVAIEESSNYGNILPPGVDPIMTPREHAQYWTCPRCGNCQLPSCAAHKHCLHDGSDGCYDSTGTVDSGCSPEEQEVYGEG